MRLDEVSVEVLYDWCREYQTGRNVNQLDKNLKF